MSLTWTFLTYVEILITDPMKNKKKSFHCEKISNVSLAYSNPRDLIRFWFWKTQMLKRMLKKPNKRQIIERIPLPLRHVSIVSTIYILSYLRTQTMKPYMIRAYRKRTHPNLAYMCPRDSSHVLACSRACSCSDGSCGPRGQTIGRF